MDTTEQETTELEVNLEEQEQETAAGETETAKATPAETQEDENEVVVTIGDEQPQAEDERTAPAWVKELRKAHREAIRENKELRAKLQTPAENKPAELGKKPTLDDFDYDAEKFETALTGWYERKRQADEAERQRQAAAKAQEEAWQATLDNYGKKKAEIRVKDFAEAEAEVDNLLSQTQRGIVLQGAENPALVVYALGKNPAKAKELASITDPVKYAFAIAKLEAQLKVTPRKPATQPEKVINGSGRVSGTVDAHMDQLREEARRTGDYTKVIAYKNQINKK